MLQILFFTDNNDGHLFYAYNKILTIGTLMKVNLILNYNRHQMKHIFEKQDKF